MFLKKWAKRIWKLKDINPNDFTLSFIWAPEDISFIGKIGYEYEGISVGYDGTRFYINNNGIKKYGEIENLAELNYFVVIRRIDDTVDLYYKSFERVSNQQIFELSNIQNECIGDEFVFENYGIKK